MLEPGLGCKIKVTFEPLIAVIHDVEALCWYGKGARQKSSVQIQAAGKPAFPSVPRDLGFRLQRAPPPVPSCLFTCFIVYQVTDDPSRWWAGDNDICLLGTVHWGYRGPDRPPSSPHPISAPAKCTQLLVSIKHKQPKDQDTEGFQKVLHFGSVAVGCTMERQIRLYNPSVVCMYWEGMGKREGAGLGDPKTQYA